MSRGFFSSSNVVEGGGGVPRATRVLTLFLAAHSCVAVSMAAHALISSRSLAVASFHPSLAPSLGGFVSCSLFPSFRRRKRPFDAFLAVIKGAERRLQGYARRGSRITRSKGREWGRKEGIFLRRSNSHRARN